MYIILGATGHVGSAVAQKLLDQGQPVTVITHDAKKTSEWEQKGATVAVADVHDVDGLRSVFQQGKRLFVLNPPAAPSTDTAREERKSVSSILTALMNSEIEKIVAESTYGAQPGNRVGDLGVLYELEEGLAKTGIPTSIIRAAYYMSNWDLSLTTARQEGKVHTLYPPDFKLPMVAPNDIGHVAAKLLLEPAKKAGLHYVEGPQHYSSADVATAFSIALNKPIEAVETAREQWIPTLRAMGFSAQGAKSMAAMTAITVEEKYQLPDAPDRGTTSLESYVKELVSKSEEN